VRCFGNGDLGTRKAPDLRNFGATTTDDAANLSDVKISLTCVGWPDHRSWWHQNTEIRRLSGSKISIAKAPHDETGERMFTIVVPQRQTRRRFSCYITSWRVRRRGGLARSIRAKRRTPGLGLSPQFNPSHRRLALQAFAMAIDGLYSRALTHYVHIHVSIFSFPPRRYCASHDGPLAQTSIMLSNCHILRASCPLSKRKVDWLLPAILF